jgi:hypothetical protein
MSQVTQRWNLLSSRANPDGLHVHIHASVQPRCLKSRNFEHSHLKICNSVCWSVFSHMHSSSLSVYVVPNLTADWLSGQERRPMCNPKPHWTCVPGDAVGPVWQWRPIYSQSHQTYAAHPTLGSLRQIRRVDTRTSTSKSSGWLLLIPALVFAVRFHYHPLSYLTWVGTSVPLCNKYTLGTYVLLQIWHVALLGLLHVCPGCRVHRPRAPVQISGCGPLPEQLRGARPTNHTPGQPPASPNPVKPVHLKYLKI